MSLYTPKELWNMPSGACCLRIKLDCHLWTRQMIRVKAIYSIIHKQLSCTYKQIYLVMLVHFWRTSWLGVAICVYISIPLFTHKIHSCRSVAFFYWASSRWRRTWKLIWIHEQKQALHWDVSCMRMFGFLYNTYISHIFLTKTSIITYYFKGKADLNCTRGGSEVHCIYRTIN